jgi:hypothetical protein
LAAFPMRHPAAVSLSLLFVIATPALPAAETASPLEWKQVIEPGGRLAFVRNLASFGLERPAPELSLAFTKAADLQGENRDIARALLLTAWVRRDPQSARKARETASPPWSEPERIRYFQALAGVSADATLSELDALPASPAKSQYLFFTFSTLSELDPQRTAREIRTRLPDAGSDAEWLFGIWGESAPEDALSALDTFSDPKQRDALKHNLLQSWITRAPEKALHWILSHEDAAQRDESVYSAARLLGYNDWDALRRLADSISDKHVRGLLEKAATETMSSQGPDKLWAQIRTKGWEGVAGHDLNSLFEYAAKRPQKEAAAFYRSVPASLIDGEYTSDLLSEPWTLADPDGALAWARSLPDIRLREHTLLHINSMLTELDPDLALAQIEQTPPGKLQSRMMRNTALALAKTDLPRATEWTFSLPPGEARDEALQGLAIAAARNQGRAFALQLEKLPAGPARTRLTGEFTECWLKEDTAAASAWVFALPDGPERKAAFRPALQALAAQSPDEGELVLTGGEFTPKKSSPPSAPSPTAPRKKTSSPTPSPSSPRMILPRCQGLSPKALSARSAPPWFPTPSSTGPAPFPTPSPGSIVSLTTIRSPHPATVRSSPLPSSTG